jgi:hypothetical protein
VDPGTLHLSSILDPDIYRSVLLFVAEGEAQSAEGRSPGRMQREGVQEFAEEAILGVGYGWGGLRQRRLDRPRRGARQKGRPEDSRVGHESRSGGFSLF